MPTVHEEGGCQFLMYFNDHEPPHVHVRIGYGRLVIDLDDVLTVSRERNVKASEIRKAQQIVKANRAKFQKAWDNRGKVE
jgi:hypothetical protein